MVQDESGQTVGITAQEDPSVSSGPPDDLTQKEMDNARLQDYKQDIDLRKKFAWATYGLMIGWLIFVVCLVSLSSTEDSVKITLVTTSTVKVIGLYIIVLKYLFNPNRHNY